MIDSIHIEWDVKTMNEIHGVPDEVFDEFDVRRWDTYRYEGHRT